MARGQQQSVESNVSWWKGVFRTRNETAEAFDAFSTADFLLDAAFACKINHVSKWFHGVSANLKNAIDFHLSWFYSHFAHSRRLPENWRALQNIASVAQRAILSKTGTRFRTGSVASLLKHTASGGSSDYAYNVAKVPFVITMEVSGDTFHPSTKSIEGIIRECWIGIRAMCVFLQSQQFVWIKWNIATRYDFDYVSIFVWALLL